MSSPLFLGLDSSTQGLKALVIEPASGRIVAAEAVNYGRDLPEYRCEDGVLANPDPLVKHADPLVWVAALDLVLARLKAAGAALDRVAGVAGSGQQHGSVYLNSEYIRILGAPDASKELAPQLAPALSRKTSPIWMDGSTGAECAEITAAVGEARLRKNTGSPAIERFTGPQIRKFAKHDPAAYAATARVHLVSSFLASVLVGADAPIDRGDGAGMNLLDLGTGDWDAAIAMATAPELLAKLPRVVAPGALAGRLAPYFEKYGLRAGTPVAVWTGDNPASLVGMGATSPGVAVVSLGTSDTFFAALDPYRTDPEGCGHVFGNPAGGFMCLACFKNGSLARDRVREEAGVDWDFFGETAFSTTTPGNEGRLALPWFEPEITPVVPAPGLRANFDFDAATPAVRIRAVVETQALALRAHSSWIGEFKTIRVTGGASRSRGILQTLANVFGARVETLAVPDSAALGAAMIAAHACGGTPYPELYDKFSPAAAVIGPDAGTKPVYDQALDAFRAFETKSRI